MNTAVLTLARYPSRHTVTALHSMPFFRLPLARNRKMSFFKLLGCGRNGSFDLWPDWKQYGVFTVSDTKDLPPLRQEHYHEWLKDYYGPFINGWWKTCNCETFSISLQPLLSHGRWNGKEVFADATGSIEKGPMAVLTRASIRPSKAIEFWKNVPPVQSQMKKANGLLFSVGVGEMPVLRQATFSVWESEAAMKEFAYSMQEHKEVIRQTRNRNWYSEEMFTRFRPLSWAGTLNGRAPLGRIEDRG